MSNLGPDNDKAEQITAENTFYIFEAFTVIKPSPIAQLDFENRRSLVRSLARLIFFLRTDHSHCVRIHSSLTTVHCFHNGYVGKQPVARDEYCAEYWLVEFKECMNRCTDLCCDFWLEMQTKTVIHQCLHS